MPSFNIGFGLELVKNFCIKEQPFYKLKPI